MKTWAAAVLALLVALPLVACGRTESGPTTLALWARSDESAFLQSVVDAFNRTHTGIKVRMTLIPTGNFVQKFGLAVAGDAGPDLASIDLVYVPFFASAGVLRDITPQVRRLSYLDKLSPAHMRNAQYGSRFYALPFSGDASVLYYNVDLFRQAGLDPDRPPTTWSRIENAATAVKKLGGGRYGFYFSGACGGCNVFTFAPLIWASGGDILRGTGTSQQPSVAASPQVRQALQFYRRLWTSGVVPPQAQTDNGANQFTPFETGKVAMFATGAFGISTFTHDFPNLHFKVTPLPGRDGGSSSFSGGDEIAISRTSQHPDAAWTFISWATSMRAQDRYFGAAGVAPIRTDVALGSYSAKGATYATLAKALVSGRAVYSVQENALINDSTGPWTTMIADAVFGGDIDGAISRAQKAMSNTISRG
ncbi:ABC transporter substrate-binding protein [Fodinicola acaciae]|uniref:ABC transporter substrate-binding protein n=1 Tax=Fodinicola acaciae TaxID=2681555 RepID=UPI0013D313DF|nr:sugar ABC transporter substrate-binding protein [Fodinicola acaciae]